LETNSGELSCANPTKGINKQIETYNDFIIVLLR